MNLKFAKSNGLLSGEEDRIIDFYLPNAKCDPDICVGATELCKKYCYGNCVLRHSDDPDKQMMMTERIATDNYAISKTAGFVDEMNELIRKTPNVKRIRIHSIGDFYDYEYFLKWIRIMRDNPEIQFTAYVKNFTVLEKFIEEGNGKPGNFNVLLSFYPDTYDFYADKGGKEYVDSLFDRLQKAYDAKRYIVCSKDFFISAIKKDEQGKYFCNGGTDMLCKQYGIDANQYEDKFIPGQGCDQCLKCYSDEKCPSGSSIYAVLRASARVANLDTFLSKQPKDQFGILREMLNKNDI